MVQQEQRRLSRAGQQRRQRGAVHQVLGGAYVVASISDIFVATGQKGAIPGAGVKKGRRREVCRRSYEEGEAPPGRQLHPFRRERAVVIRDDLTPRDAHH